MLVPVFGGLSELVFDQLLSAPRQGEHYTQKEERISLNEKPRNKLTFTTVRGNVCCIAGESPLVQQYRLSAGVTSAVERSSY